MPHNFEQWMVEYGNHYVPAALVSGVFVWIVLASLVGARRIPPADTTCPHCDYDLSGLSNPSACPECGGDQLREIRLFRRRYRLNPDRAPAIRIAAVLSTAAFLAPAYATYPVVALSCWIQFGSRWTGEIPVYSWIHFLPVAAIGPFLPLAALAPGSLSKWLMFAAVGLPAAFIVLRLTLGYWLWTRGYIPWI